MSNLTNTKKQIPPLLLLSILSLLFTVPTATSVVAMQLGSSFKPPVSDPDSGVAINPAFAPKKEVIAGNLISQVINTASKNNHLLLWNMYPAGVRGRVFGGNGEDPLVETFTGPIGW